MTNPDWYGMDAAQTLGNRTVATLDAVPSWRYLAVSTSGARFLKQHNIEHTVVHLVPL